MELAGGTDEKYADDVQGESIPLRQNGLTGSFVDISPPRSQINSITSSRSGSDALSLSAPPDMGEAKASDGRTRARASSRRTWGRVWREFGENTTLHGVNKVVEKNDSRLMCRRVIWVLIVIGSIALFSQQLIRNVMYFWSHPVTVNVKINYNTTITFPAVTICNQNDFRITSMAGLGNYLLVRDFYTRFGKGGINLTEYGADHVTLSDIYETASHKKEDMIVNCHWLEGECGPDDFHASLTNYGYCYTFNSALNGSKPRSVTTTGADRGLRLTLNIEQYEYMKGPNPGAGIKILIHDTKEIPLVRDLGQAIPPGSHAFVGATILQVNNLPPPHGKCDSSARLVFYEEYSVPACLIECRQNFIVDRCGCRDVYMSANASGEPSVCTLAEYQGSFLSATEEFNQLKEPCNCSIPCQRTIFDATITYAAISNHDTDLFMRSGSIDALRMRFTTGRETMQRMDELIVQEDTAMVERLSETCFTLSSHLFDRYTAGIQHISDNLKTALDEMKERANFHRKWGVDKLKYVAEHNFVRGWDVMDERTFAFVASNYQELTSYLKRVMGRIANESEDASFRSSLFVQADSQLYQRRVVALRALDNVTTVYNAYLNAEPLLTYRASPQRHYDASYVTPGIVKNDDDQLHKYGVKLKLRLNQYIAALDGLNGIMQEAFYNHTYEPEALDQTTERFEAAARSYLYYKFVMQDRVAYKPIELTDAIVDEFTERREALAEKNTELKLFLTDFIDSFRVADERWHYVKYFRSRCEGYLSDSTQKKSQLAEIVMSEDMEDSINQLKAFFSLLRSRSREINLLLTQLRYAFVSMWQSFLQETTLTPFYAQLHGDIHRAVKTGNETLIVIFRYMVNEANHWSLNDTYVSQNLDKLNVWMNGDLIGTDADEKMNEIKTFFMDLQSHVDPDLSRQSEESFFSAFTQISRSLRNFAAKNEIDEDFFRQNFMEVDVFMKELSYEEIDQQIAYDETNLWSDIGGSMGLFIGASVITVFEIFDVIIVHIIKTYLFRDKKGASVHGKF